jgi:hypothetical protein
VTTPGATALATMVGFGGPVTLTASAAGTAGPVTGTVTVAAVDPTTVYVSDSAVAGGVRLGTRKRPLARIGDGVSLADPGDTVFVRRAAAGSYTEVVTIDRPLTVVGDSAAFVAGGRTDPSQLPVIRHASGAAAVTTSTTGDVTLRGFAIRHVVDGPAVDADGASVTLDRVYVNPIGAAPGSATGRGFRLRNAASATVRNSGARLVTQYGVRVQTVTTATLDTVSAEAAGASAVELTDVASATVRASTLARSQRGLTLLGTIGGIVLLDNDIFDNLFAGAVGLPTDALVLPNWWGDALGPRRAADPLAAGDSAIFPGGAPAPFTGFLTQPRTFVTSDATTLRAIFGDLQAADHNDLVPKPLTVRVTDARGRPVRGVTVTFTVRAGDGANTGAMGGAVNDTETTVVTDEGGVAKVQARASNTKGEASVVNVTANGVAGGVSFTVTSNQ